MIERRTGERRSAAAETPQVRRLVELRRACTLLLDQSDAERLYAEGFHKRDHRVSEVVS